MVLILVCMSKLHEVNPQMRAHISRFFSQKPELLRCKVKHKRKIRQISYRKMTDFICFLFLFAIFGKFSCFFVTLKHKA